jgi:carbamate kinase
VLTVVALGGNALLGPGERGTAAEQRANLATTFEAARSILTDGPVVVTHGNGPQVGNELLRQELASAEAPPLPLDVAVAQTQAEIGALVAAELEPVAGRRVAVLLTRVVVAGDDPAFADPTKPIGPLYDADQAARLKAEKGWSFKPDGDSLRRVVPSPLPKRIFEIEAIKALLDRGCVVICAGGGGIPTAYTDEPAPAGRRLVGVEAVIDKDLASALLAIDLGADVLAIVTDVDAVYSDWGTPEQRAIRRASPSSLAASEFAAGSMGPKVRAACEFVERTGKLAAIGSIHDTEALVRGEAGTVVALDAKGLEVGVK